MRIPSRDNTGFTLIELSIVLVIIGLIVGGVLAGQDLIRAAAARAQIAQIEKYQVAVNTFRGKFGYLPGDIKDPEASQFGFAARGPYAGEGDGNSILEGVWQAPPPASNCGTCVGAGELIMFWVDLTSANGKNINLIDGNFNTATPSAILGTATNINAYLPQAKLGGGNYVYVYSGGWQEVTYGAAQQTDNINYFGISAVTQLQYTYTSAPSIRVDVAYNIDKKIDDGFPQSGNVMATYVNQVTVNGANVYWAGGPGNTAPYTTATPASATSCFDNGNVGGAAQKYSLSVSGGSHVTCALSFRFQ